MTGAALEIEYLHAGYDGAAVHGQVVLHRAAAELRGNHELLLASYLGEGVAARSTGRGRP